MISRLQREWRELSVHDRYAVAMFTVLWVIPAITLVGFIVVVVMQVISR